MIRLRKEEVEQYQKNIDMFNAILLKLSGELPAHLEPYRKREDKHKAISEIEDLNDVQLLSNVWFHDELKGRIRSEMVEKTKSEAILSILEANQ